MLIYVTAMKAALLLISATLGSTEFHHIDLRYNVGPDGNYNIADLSGPAMSVVTSSTVLGRPGARDAAAASNYHIDRMYSGDRESLLPPQQVQTSYKQDTTQAENTVDGDVRTSWSSSYLNHGQLPGHSLATRASFDNPDRSQWVMYDLGSFRSIRAIRIHVSGLEDTPYDCLLQVGTTKRYTGQLANLLTATPREVALLGLPSVGAANASAQIASNVAQLAFDGNPRTAWTSCLVNCFRGGATKNDAFPDTPGFGDDFPITLDYRFNADRQWRVTAYEIMPRMRDPTHNLEQTSELAKRDPRSWYFEGSKDGYQWDVLDTRSMETFVPGVANTYSITNSVSYSRYRFNFTENNWGPQYHSKASITIAEIKLLSPDVQSVSEDFSDALSFRLHKAPGWQEFGGFQASGRYFKLKALNNYGYRSGRVGTSTRINEVELLS
jgi:hypothetical protein